MVTRLITELGGRMEKLSENSNKDLENIRKSLRLNHEEIENLGCLITSNDIKSVIKKNPSKQKPSCLH